MLQALATRQDRLSMHRQVLQHAGLPPPLSHVAIALLEPSKMPISAASAARLPGCHARALQRRTAGQAPWRAAAGHGSPSGSLRTASPAQQPRVRRCPPLVRATGPSDDKGELIDVQWAVRQAHQRRPTRRRRRRRRCRPLRRLLHCSPAQGRGAARMQGHPWHPPT